MYITNWIFTGIYQAACRLTDNKETFQQAEGLKLNYSRETFNGIMQMLPSGLLEEKDVHAQEVRFKTNGASRYPFANDDTLLGFDVFAAAFYFITRYEEYLPHEQDIYGRFPASASLQCKMNALQQPVVDEWLQLLRTKLPLPVTATPQRFAPLFTYDVDTAYAFKERPFKITAGNMLKDLLSGKWKQVKQRINVLRGKEKDPYDTYDSIITGNRENRLNTLFFFLLGDQNQYNRNLNHDSAAQQQLVKKISEATATGLHPSYYSSTDAAILQEEKRRMEQLTGQRVIKSRQHYLRVSFPQTYRQLAAAGIQEEYSMGFAETPGFRAGTCFPFYFFDLQQNRTTTLKVFPVTFMEGSFAEDMHMQPEDAFPVMLQLLNTVKKMNGFFCCIWHNHTLSDMGMWKGWKNIHDRISREATT